MSILELKQAVSRLSKRERAELQAYLIRLRHNTPEWKREAAKRLKLGLSSLYRKIEELGLEL